jgi:predicted nucleotide-binding protein (sugar kinase/HSP70/actin superfamily)
VQEFTVDGEKTYWGDKCSEKYRKHSKVDHVPVVDDLCRIRETLLREVIEENGKPGPIVGIPMAMYTYDRLPFFAAYLTGCGFCTVLSDPTNTVIANKGVECVVAEPCYPVTVAHGHVKHLIDSGVEYVWMPNIINSETDTPEVESHVCVWGSTLPFVAGHAASLHAHSSKFITPTIHFRDGERVVKDELFHAVRNIGISRKTSDAAYIQASAAQALFRRKIHEAGTKALRTIRESGAKAIILLGRPYNLYDRAINLSVASKLATIYGINVIPMEFLPLDGVRIDTINDNMYWNYGRKIVQTAVMLSREPQFDLIYITNFKCGPDSFIKQYIRDALGRPFLVLQFDGHSNDAGMMTRCEAYLDSKGFLRN